MTIYRYTVYCVDSKQTECMDEIQCVVSTVDISQKKNE